MARPTWLPAHVSEALAGLTPPGETWLVGGAVRDRFLERPTIDFDFAVAGQARRLARRFADALGGFYYDLDRTRDAGRVLAEHEGLRQTFDFARLRGSDIQADLKARDFTINAMGVALDRPGDLIDPTGGLQDIKDKTLRACGPDAIREDPIRGVRAVRLASELGLRIDPGTLGQVRGVAALLGQVSAERIRDELLRMVDFVRPGPALRSLDLLGLLTVLLPELEPLRGLEQPPPHALPALEHTLAVVDRLSAVLGVLSVPPDVEAADELTLAEVSLRLGRFREALGTHLNERTSHFVRVRQILFLAALLHDVGKANTATTAEDGRVRFLDHERVGAEAAAGRMVALRLSADEVERVRRIVAVHMRPESMEATTSATDRAVYRFYRKAGAAGVDAALISLADFLGKYAFPPPQQAWSDRVEVVRRLLEAYFERRSARVEPPRLVGGDDLIQDLGVGPGPGVGLLLEAIREAQAAGEIRTREQALALARRLLEQGRRGDRGEERG
jgi:putative nucleotidyltransferase with HDIG domain